MSKEKKALVVIPTYNERANILGLIPKVLAQDARLEVLVVDDASPDGTAQAVRGLMRKSRGRVHLMSRGAKLGLGTAYVAGFRWGLDAGYGSLLQMDADWSHDPASLPQFLQALEGADVVLGSRYLHGRVSVVNWPIRRLLLSSAANLYVRWVTGLPYSDCTGGYKAFRRSVLEHIGLEKIHSDGYSFQIEMSYKAAKLGYRFQELAIIFIDRTSGSSKMSARIIREAVWRVWAMRLGI
jgi:dolichol-phosphate mannosyltransferase